MKHLLSRVLALAVTLSISMGSAAFFTGEHLQEICLDKPNGLCLGFVRGFHAGLSMAAAELGRSPYYCWPENVTATQAVKIVSKFLEENPEHLHQPAQSLVYAALYIAFPCEDGQ